MRDIKMNGKGFTLIELLAVIIILAVIMVFAIPAVLDTSNDAQKKAFKMYVERVAAKALEKAMSDQLLGTGSATTSATYNLKNDLKFSDTGNYSGCAKMVKTSGNQGSTGDYTITVYLTDGRFCTPTAGVSGAQASTFTVVETGCTATMSACSS